MSERVTVTYPNILAVKNENSELQKMPIISFTSLINLYSNTFVSNLNTCQTNSIYKDSFSNEYIEVFKNVCRIKVQNQVHEQENNFTYLHNLVESNTIINLLEMLTKKIIPLHINCVGKCDHDFKDIDTDEERSIIKKIYKDVEFNENEKKYSYEKLPINLSTDGKRLVVFINNGSNERKKVQTNNGEREVKQRHSFMPEKRLLFNLRRFFIQSPKYKEEEFVFLYDIFIKENDEIDVLVDNNNNITICDENDELNENGQKILNSLIKNFPQMRSDTIERHLKIHVKENLSVDPEFYNIEDVKKTLNEQTKEKEKNEQISDKDAKKQATKNFIEDVIRLLLIKFNEVKSDVPLEIFSELQSNLLCQDTIIDNDSFAAIHFFQCIVYACFMHYLNESPQIRKAVIMNIINLRDELSGNIIELKEIENKLNKENPFDFMVKKIYVARSENTEEAKSQNISDIEEIKNKAKIFYSFLFPQDLDHATQFNFFDFDNNDRTYNDGIILNDGRLVFPLAKLHEIFIGRPINSGTVKIADGSKLISQDSEIKFWQEEVPINDLKNYQPSFVSPKDIVDNINLFREKLKHLNAKNSCRCLDYIQRHVNSEEDKKQKFSIFFAEIQFLISNLSGTQIFNWYKYIDIQYFDTVLVTIDSKKELIECSSKMNNPSRKFIEKTVTLFNRETAYPEIQKNFYNNLFQKIVQAQNSQEFESYFANEIFINKNFQERFLGYLNENKKNRTICCLIVNKFSDLFFEKYSNILSEKDICDIYLNVDAELFLNCNDHIFLSFIAYFNDNFDKQNGDEIAEILERLKIKINK